jgi:hypothetical protein
MVIAAMQISINVKEVFRTAIKQVVGDTEESIIGTTMLQVSLVLVVMEGLTKISFSKPCRR